MSFFELAKERFSVRNFSHKSIEEEKLNQGIADIVPSFINNEVGNVSAKKGTLMHLILQKIEFGREYSRNDLEELLEELIAKKIILEEDRSLINLNKILLFTKSDLYKKISNSKSIEKEKAFCMKLDLSDYKLNDVNNEEKIDIDTDIISAESVLVQGIIDLYAIDNDNEIVLVDYKTDFVEDGKENVLKERYSIFDRRRI